MGEFHNWQIAAAILLLGLILYGPSLNDGFHFDDDLILKDSNVTSSERWHHFFSPWRLRQVTFFSFYLNYQAGGDDAFAFHAVNLAIHMANAYLLYRLLFPLTSRWLAVAAALIFFAHPVQTESVVYVYQRSTLLGTFFGLIGLILVSGALRKDKENPQRRIPKPGPSQMALAGLCFLLAFESKESALALPLLILLFGGLKSRAARWILPLVFVSGASALAILAFLDEKTVGVGALEQIGPGSYFLTEVRVLYTYLRLLVMPYPQSLEYDFQAVDSIMEAPVLLGLGGLCLMILASRYLLLHPQFCWAGIGAASFFILLAPTSSVIPSLDFAFEHRLYMPMLGFAVFAAFWLSRLDRRTLVTGFMVGLLGVATLARGSVWASDVSLWEDTVRKAPGKARPWFNLGGAHLENNPERAREAFLKAIELQPTFPEALYNLGVISQAEGDEFGALDWYGRALEQDPEYWPAINNMGNVRFTLGDHTGAVRDFERTLELNPDYWPAQYNLAIVYSAMGRPDRAIPKLRIVLDWSPQFAEARYLLAVSLERVGRRIEAQEEFERLGENRQGTGFPDVDQQRPLPATN